MSEPRKPYYTGPQAADFTGETDPFRLFEAWYKEAWAYELNDANAMSLATVGTDGMPNVRMVLLKGLDAADHAARGFVFFTNFESAKGCELGETPKAALCFHWKSLRRQVRVRGTVSVVTAAEADAYYATRPRGSQLGAWASQQSRPMASRYALEKAVAYYTARYPLGTIPRPPHWSGFRITPAEIEFWHDRPFRLHDRVAFTRQPGSDNWARAWLFP